MSRTEMGGRGNFTTLKVYFPSPVITWFLCFHFQNAFISFLIELPQESVSPQGKHQRILKPNSLKEVSEISQAHSADPWAEIRFHLKKFFKQVLEVCRAPGVWDDMPETTTPSYVAHQLPTPVPLINLLPTARQEDGNGAVASLGVCAEGVDSVTWQWSHSAIFNLIQAHPPLRYLQSDTGPSTSPLPSTWYRPIRLALSPRIVFSLLTSKNNKQLGLQQAENHQTEAD